MAKIEFVIDDDGDRVAKAHIVGWRGGSYGDVYFNDTNGRVHTMGYDEDVVNPIEHFDNLMNSDATQIFIDVDPMYVPEEDEADDGIIPGDRKVPGGDLPFEEDEPSE